jgi:hypothetical protein
MITLPHTTTRKIRAWSKPIQYQVRFMGFCCRENMILYAIEHIYVCLAGCLFFACIFSVPFSMEISFFHTDVGLLCTDLYITLLQCQFHIHTDSIAMSLLFIFCIFLNRETFRTGHTVVAIIANNGWSGWKKWRFSSNRCQWRQL